MRTSGGHLRIRTDEYLAVFDRQFVAGAEPADSTSSPLADSTSSPLADFLERIDELTDKGESLKRGDTSCVSRLQWNGKDIVIKRYNHRGLFHSLRRTIMGSRARKSWLHAHRLMMLNIPTPKPLAYIESRKWALVWKSYLVTEYAEGENLHHFLRDKTVSEEGRLAVVRQVLEMVERVHKNGITHCDLKPSNILVTGNGPVLTDLDAMKVHRVGWVCEWSGRKYIERFRQRVSNGFPRPGSTLSTTLPSTGSTNSPPPTTTFEGKQASSGPARQVRSPQDARGRRSGNGSALG